jgi:hypothetical protein
LTEINFGPAGDLSSQGGKSAILTQINSVARGILQQWSGSAIHLLMRPGPHSIVRGDRIDHILGPGMPDCAPKCRIDHEERTRAV